MGKFVRVLWAKKKTMEPFMLCSITKEIFSILYWGLNASKSSKTIYGDALVWVEFFLLTFFLYVTAKKCWCVRSRSDHTTPKRLHTIVLSLSVLWIEEINNKHDRLRRATTIIRKKRSKNSFIWYSEHIRMQLMYVYMKWEGARERKISQTH